MFIRVRQWLPSLYSIRLKSIYPGKIAHSRPKAQILYFALLIAVSVFSNAQAAPTRASYTAALNVADFILSLQDAGGAIRDEPEGKIVNEDSNMEYALIGLAAAYEHSRDQRYLTGLEKGIAWLAQREEMVDPKWKGSWYYTYSSVPPYARKATSPGGGIKDVRGVDATSSLFVYLLYLHKRVTGSDALVKKYEQNAKAALDFVLTRNWSKDGFSLSSWQLNKRGQWVLWRYEYTADQGDVYLGLRAGALLYGAPQYASAANNLMSNVSRVFFLSQQGRYAIGRDDLSAPDTEMGEFDAVFPQGYVPWVFGLNNQNVAAYNWLKKRVQSDGSLKLFSGDPGFSLSAIVFAMAAQALGAPSPDSSIDWLIAGIDPSNGGIHDTADVMESEYANVAGFAVVALLGQSAW
jgi:hypothetical protein